MAATATTRWALLAAASVLAVACTAGSAAPVAGPEGRPGVERAPVVTTRHVPGPVDGALRTRVPADGSASTGPDHVLVVGDSVSVLVADELAQDLPATLEVDGVDCRRMDRGFTGPCGGVPAGVDEPSGLDALRAAAIELDTSGETPDAAVVILANNAALTADDLAAAMDALADVPVVWWVTTSVAGRGWRGPNNALLADLAAADRRAGLVDWYAFSDGRDWFSDNVHPNEAGQAALAGLIAAQVTCACPTEGDRP